MSEAWGRGSARKVAYDLIDDALKDLIRGNLDESYGYVLDERDDLEEIRAELVKIKAEIGDRCDFELFPWDRVVVGAMFAHATFRTAAKTRETCKIYKLTYFPDGAISQVFYDVGGPHNSVWSPVDKFPAAVDRWLG